MMSASVFTSLTNCVRTKGEGGGGRWSASLFKGIHVRVSLDILNILTVRHSECDQSQSSVKVW